MQCCWMQKWTAEEAHRVNGWNVGTRKVNAGYSLHHHRDQIPGFPDRLVFDNQRPQPEGMPLLVQIVDPKLFKAVKASFIGIYKPEGTSEPKVVGEAASVTGPEALMHLQVMQQDSWRER